jgi:alpha-methylacyl-CoA racemase
MGSPSEITAVEMAGVGPSFRWHVAGCHGCQPDPRGRWQAACSARCGPADVVSGGAQSIAVDLTTDEGVELALKLVDPSDVLIASCRQGVMEQPGLSPQTCLEPNPRPAVIGGHGEGPMPQPNLVGEYGGGGMMLGEEVVAAPWLAARTGGDQVVDAAMVDGSAVPMARFYRMKALGHWIESGGPTWSTPGAVL